MIIKRQWDEPKIFWILMSIAPIAAVILVVIHFVLDLLLGNEPIAR